LSAPAAFIVDCMVARSPNMVIINPHYLILAQRLGGGKRQQIRGMLWPAGLGFPWFAEQLCSWCL